MNILISHLYNIDASNIDNSYYLDSYFMMFEDFYSSFFVIPSGQFILPNSSSLTKLSNYTLEGTPFSLQNALTETYGSTITIPKNILLTKECTKNNQIKNTNYSIYSLNWNNEIVSQIIGQTDVFFEINILYYSPTLNIKISMTIPIFTTLPDYFSTIESYQEYVSEALIEAKKIPVIRPVLPFHSIISYCSDDDDCCDF